MPAGPNQHPKPVATQPSHAWIAWIFGGMCGFVAACVVAWVGCSAVLSPYAWRSARDFDRAAWIEARDDPGGARYLMLGDVLKRHVVKGRTRAELLERLGPPHSRVDVESRFDARLSHDDYRLGPEPSSTISTAGIWLTLDYRDDLLSGHSVWIDPD